MDTSEILLPGLIKRVAERSPVHGTLLRGIRFILEIKGLNRRMPAQGPALLFLLGSPSRGNAGRLAEAQDLIANPRPARTHGRWMEASRRSRPSASPEGPELSVLSLGEALALAFATVRRPPVVAQEGPSLKNDETTCYRGLRSWRCPSVNSSMEPHTGTITGVSGSHCETDSHGNNPTG